MATRSTNPLHRLVPHLRRAALMRAPTELSDGRLLESFLACRDEAAFAMLVKRHGPMVLGVCRRVIGNLHDAEDAFQAVFMVLARKASSIMPRDLVGNWLHGVAYRTALQARDRLGRHRARERQVKEMPQPTVAPDLDLRELHQALDRELHELPEKYRVPIVLCDLEGRSRQDVACQLKVPQGTLSSRLSKGRQMLAGRLARHGLMLSGGALATAMAEQAASAAVQPALVVSTVQAAALTAAGQSAAGLVSAEAVALSQGVLKTMFLSKLRVISSMILGVVLGGLGAGFIGLPGYNPPAVHAALPGEFAGAGQPEPGALGDQEPLDGILLLQQHIQKELRLSKKQVSQLQAISGEVDTRSAPKQQEIQQIEKQIQELQKHIAKLQQDIGNLQQGIEDARGKSLGKAAADILSAKAVQRLREIQRQHRSLDELLEDPKVQRMLKVDDEQLKRIETILKTEPRQAEIVNLFHADGRVRLWDLAAGKSANALYSLADPSGMVEWGLTGRAFLAQPDAAWILAASMSGGSAANETTLRKLHAVLTPVQQRTLQDWIGEPYNESWKILRAKK